MTAVNPPVNGVAFIVYVALQDMVNPGSYKANPTIAAGDFQVSIDGGAFANLATLPTVTPAAGRAVKISLSAAEMTGDNIFIQCVDQTNPKEWADYAFNIQTVAALWATSTQVTNIQADTDDIQTRLPAALVSGRIDASVGAMAANTLTATAIAADAITAAKVADGTIDTGTFAAGTTIPRVTLADTLTTYTGNTPQTGDSFARIGAPAGASVSADIAQVEANVLTGLGFVDTEVAAIKAKTDNLPDAPAAVSDIPTVAQNADKLLGRNLAGGSDGGRTVQDALRILRNKRSIAAGTLTVTIEDDTTPAWTAAVTTAVSNPVNSIDP